MVPTMTVRQRLLAALQCEETDRMPIALYGVYPHSPDDWRQSKPSYRPLLEFAREHTDPFCQWVCKRGVFYNDIPARVQSLEGDAFAEWTVETPAGPLTSITNTSPATQWIKKFYLTDDNDVQRFLSIPYRPVCPDLGPALALEAAVGERALMTTSLLDALGVVADLFTPDDFAIRCLQDKGTVKKLIEKVHEHLQDYLHYLLDHGPRSLYIIGGPELATAPLLSPAYFDAFVIPYDSQLINMIHQHGSWVVIHCHGRLNGVLERIAGMGPDGLHPMEAPPMGDVPLAEVKCRVGDRLCLIGNVQIGDVVGGLAEDVDRQVEEAVTYGAPGGGFILSTTASPYEEELSPNSFRNYRQLVESGRRHAFQINR